MDKEKRINHGKKRPYSDEDYFGAVASSNECTGLTALVPENEQEAEAYKDIYNIPLEPEKSPGERDNEYD